jgi:hypothetical protein
MLNRKIVLLFTFLITMGNGYAQTTKLLEFNTGITDFMIKLIDYENPAVTIAADETYTIPGYYSFGLLVESETQPDVYLGVGAKLGYLTKEVTTTEDSSYTSGSSNYSVIQTWKNEYTFIRLEIPVYLRTRLFYAGLQFSAYLSRKNDVTYNYQYTEPGVPNTLGTQNDTEFLQRTVDVALLGGTKIKLSRSLMLDIKADIGLARNLLGNFDTKYRVNTYSVGLSYKLGTGGE